ncbi:hypothetical protein WN48_02500 [Eufriesea mexicana]|nr:hypothetical protein WN48_02500 [Eufriesea mexicana]
MNSPKRRFPRVLLAGIALVIETVDPVGYSQGSDKEEHGGPVALSSGKIGEKQTEKLFYIPKLSCAAPLWGGEAQVKEIIKAWSLTTKTESLEIGCDQHKRCLDAVTGKFLWEFPTIVKRVMVLEVRVGRGLILSGDIGRQERLRYSTDKAPPEISLALVAAELTRVESGIGLCGDYVHCDEHRNCQQTEGRLP